MTAKNTRVYLVGITADEATQRKASERLVEASSQSQASAHVTKDIVTVKVATPEDTYRLAKAGAVIEKTGEAAAS
jgi:tRNA A37 N6-isopentenylltransferase MiaA